MSQIRMRALAGVVGLGLALSACATTTGTGDSCAKADLALKSAGKLTVGTDNPAFPPWFGGGEKSSPWKINDPATGKGYESAVVYAVAKKLGFEPAEVTWTVVPFDKAFSPGTKDFDILANQVSISPQRAKAVTFSSGYYNVNQAVIAQALHDLRNGQLRRCKAMGFGEEELDALKHAELVSMLVNATVSWCSVSVNREVLKRLLSQVHDVEREIATVDRMLRLGASTEMVSKFYGLTHQEVALRREILGLPKRKGRHPVLDEEQDTELWRQWKAVTNSRTVDLEDETSILDAAMDLAEGMSLPLSVVWASIKGWVDQGLA